MKEDSVMDLLRKVKSGDVSVEDARKALEDAELTEEDFVAAVDHGVFNEPKLEPWIGQLCLPRATHG